MKFTATATSYILFTRDPIKLAQFYSRAFGFKVAKDPRYKETEWLELVVSRAFRICLHRWPAPGSAAGNRNKMVFVVSDLTAARRRLVAEGAKMSRQRPGAHACDGRDLDGNLFRIKASGRS